MSLLNTEITALAREYAEEYYNIRGSVDLMAGEAENVIRFLLRRYALVEKSKVEEEYHEAKFTCGNVAPCSETFATSLAQKSVLERIFPDLGKEVDG